MKPAVDEMFPEGAGPYVDLDEAGGSTGLLMDLAANEKAVHADFFNARLGHDQPPLSVSRSPEASLQATVNQQDPGLNSVGRMKPRAFSSYFEDLYDDDDIQ
ncbi:COP9 signalosome complex subunit 9 isoform X1 [Rhinatrema bivittatum]|uniref:COP9 signalosome complex subunit 9 isoform X1 n=1 Tax=Rhinatrema bivittatum TaxID=194408 RepID=UPI00112E7D96|nr:COP9 signalosome complex subunit 9 isoform X1 [Rhinatrema bivittatum]